MAAFAFSASSHAAGDARISGPHVHDNLAVYFIHGESAGGPVPLTLAEAIEQARVKVFETGDVNELKIENIGDEAVFIQSGDIVKGGKQDRVITSSLIVPPKSGEVPLAAFCVEQGRWSARGTESVARFTSSYESVPSREAKLAMKAPRAAATGSTGENRTASRQADVWDSVSKMQMKLSSGVRADVASPSSETSLQLSLENEKLKEQRSAYVKALQAAGEGGGDIVGYAFAINGKLNSVDVYASNGLFRKMWAKQVQSAATEAIGEKDGKAEPVPSGDAVKAFLGEAKQGAVKKKVSRSQNDFEVREGTRAVYFASSPASGEIVHENYLAK